MVCERFVQGPNVREERDTAPMHHTPTPPACMQRMNGRPMHAAPPTDIRPQFPEFCGYRLTAHLVVERTTTPRHRRIGAGSQQGRHQTLARDNPATLGCRHPTARCFPPPAADQGGTLIIPPAPAPTAPTSSSRAQSTPAPTLPRPAPLSGLASGTPAHHPGLSSEKASRG